MSDCPDIPSVERLPDWAEPLLAALADGPLAISLYDANQQLRYANAAYRDIFLKGQQGPISFADMLRYGFEHGCGIQVDDGNLDRILATVAERWRRKPARVSFESDLRDGRWLWMTETWLPSGWMLSIAADITPLKHNEKTLRQAHDVALLASLTDSLTGLPNRRHMMELAQCEMEQCRASNAPLSVAMIDLDHFKEINDLHGHAVGDKVLAHFAMACKRRLREQDRMGRIGGEEFLLLLPGADLARATAVVRRTHQDFPALSTEAAPLHLAYTFSAGLAEMTPGDDLDSLLRRADDALYRAKAEGRNRVR
jgi:diguanylate cyclase (GGDEF)-like protein